MAFPTDILLKCWFLTGPTACGKTATSLSLTERINAEVVALDSMTLYRGLDIGTAKPSQEERLRVRHHLLDIIEPENEFSLAEYLAAAETACREILSRGRSPLFVGGTGLYLRGLLRGIFEGPPADWSIRSRLERLRESNGAQALHEQLRSIDPISAMRLHVNDQRRIIRAIEVFELTGKPLSSLQQQGPRSIEERPRNVYWLSPPRNWLHERINQRVVAMFNVGLLDEVRQLLERAEPISHTARQALGYKEVIDWFEANDSISSDQAMTHVEGPIQNSARLSELVDLIQTRTRQFAKRQHTWFRNLEECVPVTINGEEKPEEIADRILQMSHSV